MAILVECPNCDGAGCLSCNQTGEVKMSHRAQCEATVLEISDIDDKLDDVMDKLDDILEKLNE